MGQDAGVRRGQGRPSLWSVAVALVVVSLNVAFLAFFELYLAVDEWAVDRSEAHGGFDQSQLLPHDVLLWSCAHVALVLLIAVDVLLLVLVVRQRRRSAS